MSYVKKLTNFENGHCNKDCGKFMIFLNLKIIIIEVEIHVKKFIEKSKAEQIRPGLLKMLIQCTSNVLYNRF